MDEYAIMSGWHYNFILNLDIKWLRKSLDNSTYLQKENIIEIKIHIGHVMNSL